MSIYHRTWGRAPTWTVTWVRVTHIWVSVKMSEQKSQAWMSKMSSLLLKHIYFWASIIICIHLYVRISLNIRIRILAELATEKLIWGQILGGSGVKWKGFTYCILHILHPLHLCLLVTHTAMVVGPREEMGEKWAICYSRKIINLKCRNA